MKKLPILFILFFILFGCDTSKENKLRTLTLGAYTVPKEVYQKEIIPGFKKYWKDKTGEDIRFYESYMASGAQSRTITSGLEADIAALSLEKDINRLEKAGLITHNWKNTKYNGFVTRSVVVICYRSRNPKVIKGWEDLKRQDVEVIYPSPKTSGGAMWVVNAIYGSGLQLSELDQKQKDPSFAKKFLKDIQKRVKVMDKSGRASVSTFENGIGDVLVTYENEALLRQKQGKEFPFIIPRSTILIENPVALLDKNVEKHQNRDIAEAFIEYLFSNPAQRAFADYGFRPVNELISLEYKQKFPTPEILFKIHYLGGWDHVYTHIYGLEGVWTKVTEELATE
ncbi:MAG: sulfate ABC transporter substrate-binding protein [Candidatus Aminicenantes bacterium]|nr:sulfate ABC transporter substrate-binding protein [Candidatus Aminicenantes bacterium]